MAFTLNSDKIINHTSKSRKPPTVPAEQAQMAPRGGGDVRRCLLAVLAVATFVAVLLACLSVPTVTDDSDAQQSGSSGDDGNIHWVKEGDTLTLSKNSQATSGDMKNYGSGGSPWCNLNFTDCVISDGVTSIGSYAFTGSYYMSSVTIPNSVTSIGDYAFNGYNNLGSVTIPVSVTSIGKGAFYGSKMLKTVTFEGSSSITTISNYMFYNCGSLESVTIPDNVTTIGSYAFNQCSQLNMNIPGSVTSIGNYAFEDCAHLKSVIPGSVTSIGDSAFKNCSELTSVTLGSSDESKSTTIGNNAFKGCRNLTSVTILLSVTFIGADAFDDCGGLKSITFPDKTYGTALSNCFKGFTFYLNGTEKVTSWEKVKGEIWKGGGNKEFYNGELTVTLNPNGGSVDPVSVKVIYGEKYGNLPTPEPSEYFQGWYTGPASGGKIEANTNVMFVQSLTLYAHWSTIFKTVTFDVQGHGTAPENQCVAVDGKVTKPADPTADKYTFGGWYKESTYENEWKFDSYTVNGDTTLYAKWTAKTYTVTLDENYDGITRNFTATYDSDDLGNYSVPERTGYTFGGYFADKDCTKMVINTDKEYVACDGYTAVGPDGKSVVWQNDSEETITLYAKWTIITYTVTFNIQGHGAAPASQRVDYGGTVTEPADPTADRYTFGGWYKEEGCSNEWNFGTDTVAGDTTIYAKWTAFKYPATFDLAGGSVVSVPEGWELSEGKYTKYFDYGTAATAIIEDFGEYGREGYDSGSEDVSTDTMGTEGMTITATWTAKTYTVTLNENYEGSTPRNFTATYDSEALGSYSVPARIGYTFGGYFADSECTKKVIGTDGKYVECEGYTATVGSDVVWKKDSENLITLYAKWTAEGDDGDIHWEMEGDTFTIGKKEGGSSEMRDYSSTDRPEWMSYPEWSSVTEVVIEDGVTTIGSYAFYNCTNLESVTIPDSVHRQRSVQRLLRHRERDHTRFRRVHRHRCV